MSLAPIFSGAKPQQNFAAAFLDTNKPFSKIERLVLSLCLDYVVMIRCPLDSKAAFLCDERL